MYRKLAFILLLILLNGRISVFSQEQGRFNPVEFNTDSLRIKSDFIKPFPSDITESALRVYMQDLEKSGYHAVINALLSYRQNYKLDDWLYYQVVRKAAEKVSPKAENYFRYTFYKWFFLAKSGYNVALRYSPGTLLFYVQSDEDVYNIPLHIKNGKQYVCLNSHDYKQLNIDSASFTEINLVVPEATGPFSYKINKLPNFISSGSVERTIQFTYKETNYQYRVKLDRQVQDFFANYPVVDYSSYLNIPLSGDAYQSLIPALKKNLRGLSAKNGIDYLMRFVRSAFAFQTDSKNFGGEKRLSAEQTLFYKESDCDDRVGLFYYLVKEIYDLPMIVLTYPNHVSIAVQLQKPLGETISYQGAKYSVCEATPQKQDLAVGEVLPQLRNTPFEIVYAYTPLAHQPAR